MCRMAILSGDYSRDLKSIFNALSDACRDDWLYERVYGKRISHDDGWGYLFMSHDRIIYDRIGNPVFQSQMPDIPGSGILMIHARKAAEGEPLGVLNCHPHHREDFRGDVYLSHNGAFHKERIGKILGNDVLNTQTDSEFFLELIMSKDGTTRERFERAVTQAVEEDLIKTTANLFLAARDKTTGEGEAYYYSTARSRNVYNTLYYVDAGLWRGVFSSTIVESEYFPKSCASVEVEMNRVMTL